MNSAGFKNCANCFNMNESSFKQGMYCFNTHVNCFKNRRDAFTPNPIRSKYAHLMFADARISEDCFQ